MKNTVEKATNLVRETKKYVPFELFRTLLNDYADACWANADDEEADSSVERNISAYKADANAQARDFYIIDEDREKGFHRPMDVCPYCDAKMEPFIENRDAYGRYPYRNYTTFNQKPHVNVGYVCLRCGAKSPITYFDTDLLDISKLNKAIDKEIGINIEEDEEEDDI